MTDSTFSGWVGGGCSGAGPCTTTIKSSRTVKVVFTAVGVRTLTVSKAGTGIGTVTGKAAGINCGATCSSQVPAGKKVTLSAKAVPGSSFAHWSGACSGTGACKVTMTEARSVTATFTGGSAAAPPSAGRLRLAATAKVKGQKALVRVSCKGASPCKGILKLLAKLKDAAGKAKSVVIGSAPFNLAPGATQTLKVKLSPKAIGLLRSAGRLKARARGAGIEPHAVRLK